MAFGEANVSLSELNQTLEHMRDTNPGLVDQAKVALIDQPEDLALVRECNRTAASRLFWRRSGATDVRLAANVQAPALFVNAKNDALMPLATA